MNHHTRRSFLQALAAAGAAVIPPANGQQEPAPKTSTTPDNHTAAMSMLKAGTEKIVIRLYPGFTALDAIPPHYALAGMIGAEVKFMARTLDPVRSESGYTVSPHISFDQCPEHPDLLLIPGGTAGTVESIEDAELLAFIGKTAKSSKLIGGICTGALILGAAGLLKGYNATTHWQTLDLLPVVGAKPSKERVVVDRNLVTCGGVTAALDLGFELVRRYRGDFYAQGMQLLAEYDPKPPFPKGGNPATADPLVVALLNAMHSEYVGSIGTKLKVGGRKGLRLQS